ncbi:nucleotidyltransferase [Flavobacterium sp. TR2]|uniref:nucleotidyltransferase n=1 Tax=Flavobacterium sp. TR2 TaxID=2977321 RepID=UPI0021B12CDD|nr:nucleotidyltransferase [Flavobacterium sp. TR2]UWY28794.1 nucleotidyltransferase [Flavobacterium sp. TR2]
MARTIAEIQKQMLDRIAADETLSVLNSTSKTAIFRLFAYIIAFGIAVHESFFDQHFKEVKEMLDNDKAGSLPWYRTMALRFQYGFDLVQDKDYFDNAGATDEQIENSKIIKYSAVNEAENDTRIIIKIASEVDGALSDFEDSTQVEAIENYFKRIKIAGPKITIINYKADQLYLNLQIKRDVLVLDANGMSKLNGNYPVIEALEQFMKELDFNGELKLSALIDKIQQVPGVLDATLLSAQSSWINPDLGGYGVPQPIFISKIAESGYFKIVTYEDIAYVE